MRSLLRLILPLVLAVTAAAADKPVTLPAAEDTSGIDWLSALIPKAFQPNPRLEMSVFTELTPEGRKLPEASPAHPAYFVAKDQGFQQKGAALGGEHPPDAARLERTFFDVLARQGYLPATDQAHPPSLVLVYFWGSHNAMAPEDAQNFPELAEQYDLERAALVGGRRYAQQFADQQAFGVSLADRSPKKDFLRNQATVDLYYVVVSAYAFNELAQNKHLLLWRTTMTVTANGVNMQESLPALIVTGGDYFGRPMDEAAAIRRNVRRGTVTLGPLNILDEDVHVPPPKDK